MNTDTEGEGRIKELKIELVRTLNQGIPNEAAREYLCAAIEELGNIAERNVTACNQALDREHELRQQLRVIEFKANMAARMCDTDGRGAGFRHLMELARDARELSTEEESA